LTSSETPFLALVVNDKNHPFIKPAKEIISGTQILKRMVTDLPKPTAVGVMRKTNVNRLIEEVSVQAYYSMRDHYPDFSCEMRRDLEKILPDTELNAEDIRFVLFNILENAFESVWNKKSSSGKGYIPSVTVTSRKLPRYIQVRVKDNGTGVPDHVRKQIFQPFFTDREGKRHTGLGLHESYDLIVNKYKGDLILENDFQSSTDFIIRLPLKS
jgi:signal transduction histidine kinase